MRRPTGQLAALVILLAAGVSGAGADIRPTIMAGDRFGEPPDWPDDRIDPNLPSSRYGGVVSLQFGGTGVSSGIVISPYHILTAAHSFDSDYDGENDHGRNVTVNFNLDGDLSQVIEPPFIREVDLHPDFTGFNQPSVLDDLAIISMHWPLDDDVPMYDVFRGEPSPADRVELVGYGRSGDGKWGYSLPSSPTVKRRGSNTIDAWLIDDEGTGIRQGYEYDFDGPDGNGPMGGSSLGNEIETIHGPGDSGGPAFIDVAGELQVYGVNTYVREGAGDFGTIGGGQLVTGYVSWIDSFLAQTSHIDGDINWDGLVDERDLTIFLPTFDGMAGQPGYAPGSDFNRDGLVNLSDLGVLLGNLGTGRSIPAPAPALLTLSVPIIARGRRQRSQSSSS
jgi:hypothetical protein